MKFLTLVGAIIILLAMFGSWLPKGRNETTPKSPQQIAKDEALAVNVMAVQVLKRSMKNPDSFKLESALRMKDGTLCLNYRATNSFNAVVPGAAVIAQKTAATSDDRDKFRPLWNKHCAGKQGEDVKVIRWLL